MTTATTPTAGEPVAWRTRWKTGSERDREWEMWTYRTEQPVPNEAMIIEPLYTATGGDAVAGDVQSTKSLNINTTVKVKLTEVGTARWRGKHNVTRTELELPLWELMAEFGPGLHMGMSQMYFVDNEIEICNA